MVEPTPPGESGSLQHRPLVGLGLAGLLIAVMVPGFLHLHRDRSPLPAIARYALSTALPDWKTTEPVNEVVYGSRGFDTFGETFLLLAAVVSVTTLARRRERREEQAGESVAGTREQEHADPAETSSPDEELARHAEQREEGDTPVPSRPDTPRGPLGEPWPERAAGMTDVVQVGVRLVVPVLIMASVYLCAWGYSPGGGFPAGAALSGVVLLLYTAFGHARLRRVLALELVERVELAGAAAIIAIAVIGLVRKGSVSANWIPLAPVATIRSGGVLQAFSVAELIEVATGLTLAIVALLRMRHDWTPDEDDGGGRP